MPEVTARQIIESIQPEQLDELRARFASIDDPPDARSKYLDLDVWVPASVQRAYDRGLHLGNSRRILDIGCGTGYFVRTCMLLGHDVVAIDRDTDQPSVFSAVTSLLGISPVEFEVRPFEPLIDLGTFDLITSYMVTFNGHRVRPWGRAEWKFFLDDAKSRLRPGGQIYLELNREPPPMNRCYTNDLEHFFKSYGAQISGATLLNTDGHRLLFST